MPRDLAPGSGSHAPASAANRHHFFFTAAVGAAFLGTAAIFGNDWLQRGWLASKWLYRSPWGLFWLGALAAVTGLAFLRLLWIWRKNRWLSTSWVPLRWVLPALLGGWVYAWTVEPPPLVYDAQLAVAAAAAAWSAAVALLASSPDRPWPRWARLLDLALLEIALCAFAAEVALRVARGATGSSLLATSSTDVDTWIRAHRLAPGTHHLGFRVNGDGMIDVEAADAASREHLVACLGDSFSVGVVPHHLHYTSVAETPFDDLEVYNLGVVNAGPREYLRLLEVHALPLHPDLIVVALFLGNDVKDAQRSRSTGYSAWMERDEVLILEVPSRLWAFARERMAGAAVVGRGHSAETFGIPLTLALSPDEVEQRLSWLADPLQEPAVLSATRFAYVEFTRAEITLPEHREDYPEALEVLDRIRAAADPIPIACLLIPDEFQVEDAVWREVASQGLPERADRDQPQKILSAWLDERRIPYVDLLPLLRGVPPLEDGRRHVYHLRDTHFNARGNRIVGEALAELIERCGVAARRR